MSQLLGNLQLWSSLPAFIVYYLDSRTRTLMQMQHSKPVSDQFQCFTWYHHLNRIHLKSQLGFMIVQSTTRNGARCSTAKAFLRPVRHRQNLHISMRSHVLKILIDASTNKTTGVRFEKKGQIYEIGVGKEVILSAGSINSPQILMLSGIGPSDHLKSLGIPVIADLQVGNNLQDHITLGGMIFTLEQVNHFFFQLKYSNFNRLYICCL